MDIKELRIGNYIEMDKNVFSLNYIDHREIKDYLPIKITEEWLLNLGFVKNLNHGIENYITSDFTYYPDNKQVKIFDRFGGYIYVENILFVHQLQNLYFALTQKEL